MQGVIFSLTIHSVTEHSENVSEQYFNPGDKVMRVGSISLRPIDRSILKRQPPQFGEILCVERCWKNGRHNYVMFAGFGAPYYSSKGYEIGLIAQNFRKVDEIKLCLAAVAHDRAPITSPQSPVGNQTTTSHPIAGTKNQAQRSGPSGFCGVFG